MPGVSYGSYSDARSHFKELLDAADDGLPATIRREGATAAVVDAERLRESLSRSSPRAEVVAEGGGWSVFIPGVPVAADGGTFDEAIDEMVDALREYAADWEDHLRDAPNHRGAWGLVQLVGLSTDEQLAEWLTGAGG